MSPFIELLNGWSEVWLGLVWAVVWQSTLIASVGGLIAFLLCRSAPALSYWVWQIVAIKLLLMPFWIVGVPLPAIFHAPDLPLVKHTKGSRPSGGGDRAAPTELAAMPIDQSTASTELPPRARAFGLSQLTWPSWLLVTWLAVVIWQVVRIGYQRYQLGQWLRQAKRSHDESLKRMLQDSARQLGLRRVPEILFTDCECSPFVCGVWRPIVVLPGSLVTTLAAGQLRQVLLHELAHLKRNDLLWGWLPATACVVYWFHPVAHWVAYCNQFERELACDQLAIALSGQGAAGYANTLIEVASHASGGGLVIARGP